MGYSGQDGEMLAARTIWHGTLCCVALAICLQGCRFSYELLSEDNSVGIGGATGEGGANGGTASGSGGTGAGGAGTGGIATVTGDYVVTTGADESDSGATVDAPGGSGLSLREAIGLSNATTGHQVISIEPGVTVSLGAGLPSVTETMALMGNGQAIDGSSAGNATCLYVDASDVLVSDIEVFGCTREPIFFVSGSGNRLVNSHIHHNAQVVFIQGTGAIIEGNRFEDSALSSLGIYGPNAIVRDNVILDAGDRGIFVDRTGNGVLLTGNLIVRATTGIAFGGLTGATIWHNTIASSADVAVNVGQGSGVDMRNNLFTHSTNHGVHAVDDRFIVFDYNLFYGNGGGDCSGCTTLPGPNTVYDDPRYASLIADDFTLQPASPAIDAGTDTGEDRNGATAGLFGGLAPDMGYVETN